MPIEQDPRLTSTSVDAVDLARILQEEPLSRVIDIRPIAKFCEGHIPKSTHIDYEKLLLEKSIPVVGKSRKIFLIDEDESWAKSAAALLKSKGYDCIYLRGGMTAWKTANLATDRAATHKTMAPLVVFCFLVFMLVSWKIGSWTREHLCCRPSRGSVGAMECHWMDQNKLEMPRSTLLTSKWKFLISAKKSFLQCSTEHAYSFDRIENAADRAMASPLVNVIQKKYIPPSGNKHDLLTLSRYYWPDERRSNGIPYTRKDGMTNPEIYSDAYDKRAIEDMIDNVRILSLVSFIFDEKVYAKKAALQLQEWFINPKTSMTPHLRYAGYIPGLANGRGIVAFDEILDLLDATTLIEHANMWEKEDRKAFEQWLAAYLTWLETDEQALREKAKGNNRGTWYDVQAGSIEAYLGKTEKLRERMESSKIRRFNDQIESDGSMPEELRRSNPLLYSSYNLKALMDLADVAKHADIDLWNYEGKKGGSIRKAVDYLIPYALGDKQWPDQPTENTDYFVHVLQRASIAFNEPEYGFLAKKLTPSKSTLQDIMNIRWPVEE